MKIKICKLPKIFLIWVVTVLIAFVLTSCSTTISTSTPEANGTPSAKTTNTPEPLTATPEPLAGDVTDGILLPSATPAPTLTPGAINELISEFTQSQGLEEVTVFRLRVEDWLNLGYSILLTFIFGFLLSHLVYYGLTKIVARTETKYDDIFIKQIRSQIYVIIITFGFQVGTVRLDLIEALVKIRVNRFYTLIYVVAATVIIWHLIDVLVQWYQNELEPKRTDSPQADTLLLLLHRFARVFLIMISMIMVLSLYNINVTALIAALGIGSLAISLAAQDTLSNVISGIMIMIDQPFRVGDRIAIPKLGTWGDVVDIGLRSTRVHTSDNRMVIFPNSVISKDQVVNYTFPDPQYRIQIDFGIGYGQDIEKVRQVIINTVRQVEGVLANKPVDALIVNLDDISMTFRVRWWIGTYVDTRRIFDRVHTALLTALNEAGIEILSDTLDIKFLNQPTQGSFR